MDSVLKPFAALAASIRCAWRKDELDPDRFSPHAVAALEDFRPPEDSSLRQLIMSLLRERVLPRSEHPFGDLSLRVFQAQEFYLELLVWLDGTTEIHEHSFSGAFRVLAGESLHSRFRFETERRASRRLVCGSVQLMDSELLRTGTAREIKPGASFMHSLFHLERPSITLVARTVAEPWWAPQLAICAPHFAMDHSLPSDPRVTFAGRSLRALAYAPDEHRALFADLLAELDIGRAFALCMAFAEHPLLQEPATQSVISERFGDWGEKVHECLEFRQRLGSCTQMRRHFPASEDRLILGLIATVPSRERIAALAEAHLGRERGSSGFTRMVGALLERAGFRFRCNERDALDVLRIALGQRGGREDHREDDPAAPSGRRDLLQQAQHVLEFLQSDAVLRRVVS